MEISEKKCRNGVKWHTCYQGVNRMRKKRRPVALSLFAAFVRDWEAFNIEAPKTIMLIVGGKLGGQQKLRVWQCSEKLRIRIHGWGMRLGVLPGVLGLRKHRGNLDWNFHLENPRKRGEYGFGEYGFEHRTQCFSGLTEFRGANSVTSFVCKRELTEFFAELTEFAPKLSEAQWVFFSKTVLSKQYSARFLNPSHRVDGLWVVSLEAPTTEMATLEVFVGQHSHTGIQKQRSRPVSSTQRNHWEKVSKIGVDFGPEGGVDLAWIFGAGKKGLKKFGAISRQNSWQNVRQNSCQFPVKFGTGFVPQNQKCTASSHPTFAFWALGLTDFRKTPSARRERIGWTKFFGKTNS